MDAAGTRADEADARAARLEEEKARAEAEYLHNSRELMMEVSREKVRNMRGRLDRGGGTGVRG